MSNFRFLTLDDVADELNVSMSQAYALVRSGDLLGIQVGGRGQWRVERVKLEEYIARITADTPDTITRPVTMAANPAQETNPLTLKTTICSTQNATTAHCKPVNGQRRRIGRRRSSATTPACPTMLRIDTALNERIFEAGARSNRRPGASH